MSLILDYFLNEASKKKKKNEDDENEVQNNEEDTTDDTGEKDVASDLEDTDNQDEEIDVEGDTTGDDTGDDGANTDTDTTDDTGEEDVATGLEDNGDETDTTTDDTGDDDTTTDDTGDDDTTTDDTGDTGDVGTDDFGDDSSMDDTSTDDTDDTGDDSKETEAEAKQNVKKLYLAYLDLYKDTTIIIDKLDNSSYSKDYAAYEAINRVIDNLKKVQEILYDYIKNIYTTKEYNENLYNYYSILNSIKLSGEMVKKILENRNKE